MSTTQLRDFKVLGDLMVHYHVSFKNGDMEDFYENLEYNKTISKVVIIHDGGEIDITSRLRKEEIQELQALLDL